MEPLGDAEASPPTVRRATRVFPGDTPMTLPASKQSRSLPEHGHGVDHAAASPTRKTKKGHGVLADMMYQENDIYQDVLQFVLMSGGPAIGFESGVEEEKKDPLGLQNIATTLTKTASRLLEASKEVSFAAVAAQAAPASSGPPGAHRSESSIESRPGSSLLHPSSAAGDRGLSPMPPPHSPTSPDAASHATSSFTERQREHFDEVVHFVTVATTQAAIDNVLEDVAFHRSKKVIVDAMLYGLSLMCKFPVSQRAEDENGRPIREVMVQGIANLFVNLDMVCELQFLSSIRGTRVCDIIRWCLGTRKKLLLDLSIGLVFRLVVLCFPRVPADYALSVAQCAQHTDAVRRTYCGYEDCAGMIDELGLMRSIDQSFDSFKDVLFLLDEARRFFVKHPAISSSSAGGARFHRDGSARRMAEMVPTEEERLRSEQKQNPWMVAGASKDLHYISAVCFRALELWLGMSPEPTRALIASEEQERAQDIERDELLEWKELLRAQHAEAQDILFVERVTFHCLRMHGEELDARHVIEESYAERIQSIDEDLRRLNWHANRQFQLASSAAASAAASRTTTPAPSRPQSSAAAPAPVALLSAASAAVAAMPRFYFLETVEWNTIDTIERECRQETLRQERYAFSALREMWNMDFQWVQEIVAEQKREALLRQEYIVEQKRKAYEERQEEIARMRSTTSGGTHSVVSFNPNDVSRGPTSLGGRASIMIAERLALGQASVPASRAGTSLQSSSAGAPQFYSNLSTSATSPLLPNRYSSNAMPVEYSHYVYGSANATSPSSLGFGPQPPHLIHSQYIAQPATRILYPHLPQQRTQSLSGAAMPRNGNFDAQQSDWDNYAGAAPLAHPREIVVTARVVSPEDYHVPNHGHLQHRQEEEEYYPPVRPSSQAAYHHHRQQQRQELEEVFLGMLQDFLDDQEIERGLVEDEEVALRKGLQRQLREGRMMQFDWSMGGYRRLISTYSAAASANVSRGQSRSGTVLSSMGVGATYGMRVASVAGGAASLSYQQQQHAVVNHQHHQLQYSPPQEVRQLPDFMRGSNASRAASRGYSARDSSPPPSSAMGLSRYQRIGGMHPTAQSPMSPHPPTYNSGGGIHCPPVGGARPTSRLLEDILRTPTPAIAKYGAAGHVAPNPMFLPRNTPHSNSGAYYSPRVVDGAHASQSVQLVHDNDPRWNTRRTY